MARQAGQVTTQTPGWLARLRGIVSTEVLTAAGCPGRPTEIPASKGDDIDER